MADQAPASGILTLINESLSFAPERADLWMTRFDVLRTMGHRREFTQALRDAVVNTKIRKQLDWPEIRHMWMDLFPGEAFPNDAEELVPKGAPAPAAPAEPELLPDLPTPAKPARPEPPRTGVRRFKDIAVKVAGAELAEMAKAYSAAALKPGFLDDFARKTGRLLSRPTPLEYSDSLSRAAGTGMRIYLKREDKRGVSVEAEHAAAQCYIGSLLGKSHVVTGNDVDAHALEVATVASFFNMKCTIVVRPNDFQEKAALVADLKGLGAQVLPTPPGMIGSDPREGALRLWQRNTAVSHLALSLGMAPAPHTAMANAFQALVGREAEAQYVPMASLLNRPRTLVAAVGSEADSIGFVLPFLNRKDIRVAYAEPEPGGIASWRPSQRLKPYNGQVREHAWLRGLGRIQHVAVSDAEAEDSRRRMARDGITVGLEDARAVALTAMLGHGDPTPRDFLVLVG